MNQVSLYNSAVTTKKFVVNVLNIQKSLYISYEDMGVIAGYLLHNPSEWGHIHHAHPQFHKLQKDINELMPSVQLKNPTFLTHFEANWLVICDDGVFLPVILQFNPNCRDGLCVAFYRLVQGRAAAWLSQLPKYCQEIVSAEQEVKTPFDDYRLQI